MIGFISKIGKPFSQMYRKITYFFKTSDGKNVITSDVKNFKVQS